MRDACPVQRLWVYRLAVCGFYALKWMEARLCRVYERLRGGNLGIFRYTFLLAEKERLQPVSGAVAYCAGVGIKQTQEET